MTLNQFRDAKLHAIHSDIRGDITRFDGYGLPGFAPIVCTIADLASLIRWQCVCLNGAIDNEELQGIWNARRKFIVV